SVLLAMQFFTGDSESRRIRSWFIQQVLLALPCLLVSCELSLPQRFSVRVARTEMFENDERVGVAEIYDTHAISGHVRRDEQLVFRHLAKADHRRRRYVML